MPSIEEMHAEIIRDTHKLLELTEKEPTAQNFDQIANLALLVSRKAGALRDGVSI